MGVPLGNGFRIAFDPDFDDLPTAQDAFPWDPDSDGDGWPDGYEFAHGGDGANDVTPPDLLEPAELQFTTARVAKWHVRFTEDVTYVVEYWRPGGEVLRYERDYFVRADTFVLTHSSPSRPELDLVGSLLEPTPDGALVFTAQITMTDRNGLVTGPIVLGPTSTFIPKAAQFQAGMFELTDEFPDELPPGTFLHIAKMSATTEPTGTPGELKATVTIEPDLHYQDPLTEDYVDADGHAVLCTILVENSSTGQFEPSGSLAAPFSTLPSESTVADVSLFDLVPDENGIPQPEWTSLLALPGVALLEAFTPPFVLTDQSVNGSTQFTFVQPGLAPGQRVKVAVQAVLIPVDVGLYWKRSLFSLQPLLTEDDQEGLETTGSELVIPYVP
jgi:hypothetical protein